MHSSGRVGVTFTAADKVGTEKFVWEPTGPIGSATNPYATPPKSWFEWSPDKPPPALEKEPILKQNLEAAYAALQSSTAFVSGFVNLFSGQFLDAYKSFKKSWEEAKHFIDISANDSPETWRNRVAINMWSTTNSFTAGLFARGSDPDYLKRVQKELESGVVLHPAPAYVLDTTKEARIVRASEIYADAFSVLVNGPPHFADPEVEALHGGDKYDPNWIVMVLPPVKLGYVADKIIPSNYNDWWGGEWRKYVEEGVLQTWIASLQDLASSAQVAFPRLKKLPPAAFRTSSRSSSSSPLPIILLAGAGAAAVYFFTRKKT